MYLGSAFITLYMYPKQPVQTRRDECYIAPVLLAIFGQRAETVLTQ